MPRCKWSTEEDAILRVVVAERGARQWKTIARELFIQTGGQCQRTDVQCSQRWLKALQPGLKKGAWQPNEDDQLRRLVTAASASACASRSAMVACGSSTSSAAAPTCPVRSSIDWVWVASQIEGRTSKSARERWLRYLDPSINRAAWTAEEDAELLALEARIGQGKWAAIARAGSGSAGSSGAGRGLLKGRTGEAVKMRSKQLHRLSQQRESQQLLRSQLQPQPQLQPAPQLLSPSPSPFVAAADFEFITDALLLDSHANDSSDSSSTSSTSSSNSSGSSRSSRSSSSSSSSGKARMWPQKEEHNPARKRLAAEYVQAAHASKRRRQSTAPGTLSAIDIDSVDAEALLMDLADVVDGEFMLTTLGDSDDSDDCCEDEALCQWLSEAEKYVERPVGVRCPVGSF